MGCVFAAGELSPSRDTVSGDNRRQSETIGLVARADATILRANAMSRAQMQPSCGQPVCPVRKWNHLAGKRDVPRADAAVLRANAMSRAQMQPSCGRTRCPARKCNHLAGKRDV